MILFGSRARGNYRPGSDIDLALVGTDITKEDIDQIAIEVDDLLLPYQVDLIRTNVQTDSDLVNEIKQWGVSLGEIIQRLNE
ncbi:MAG: nucleotidyltransferase domain-containing protein [Saprospiraceae bacterium]|nr:nucleotidyltransferase domain-containing protein [Saprospiraceae bacterium]